MTTSDLIDYYKGLLILQYRALDKALSHVEAWISAFVQNQIVANVLDGFDLATAIGAQLDILGSYRGIKRTLFGVVPDSDWSLVPYDDVAPDSYFGWGVYADVNPPVDRFLQYADLTAVPYVLNDIQMRTLIRLQAAFQSSDGTLGNLDNILYAFFGANVDVVDNGDMTITYRHLISDPDPIGLWKATTVAGILPHGAGISFTVLEV